MQISNFKNKTMDWLYEKSILTSKIDTAANINYILTNSLRAGKI